MPPMCGLRGLCLVGAVHRVRLAENADCCLKNRGKPCKVVPQFGIAKLVNITPIKLMVYGRYNYSIHGVYKPTNITGGHHPVGSTNIDGY